MKKFLRFIGVLLLVIILGVVVLGLIAPKDISVERSIAINAPKAVVEEQMFEYKNFNNWNPWAPMDPKMQSSIIGPERQVGTKYSWKGNKDVGSGEMEIKEAKEGEIKYTMHFKEPFEDEADGHWRVEDAGNGQTKAFWGFTTHKGFPWNGLMMAFQMSKHLSEDFDKGLAKLKTVSEKRAKEAPASEYNISTVRFPGHTYATIRKTIAIDEAAMMKFFNESYEVLGKNAGARINGSASALAYKWDEQNKQADIAPAFPVSGGAPVNGATMVTVAPSKAYMVAYTGDYKNLEKVHEAIGKHLASTKEAHSLVIEEYVIGPGEEKDASKWLTNVYYLIP
jgi:effector-binding domain-containing protein